jgi:hypothetical protein
MSPQFLAQLLDLHSQCFDRLFESGLILRHGGVSVLDSGYLVSTQKLELLLDGRRPNQREAMLLLLLEDDEGDDEGCGSAIFGVSASWRHLEQPHGAGEQQQFGGYGGKGGNGGAGG